MTIRSEKDREFLPHTEEIRTKQSLIRKFLRLKIDSETHRHWETHGRVGKWQSALKRIKNFKHAPEESRRNIARSRIFDDLKFTRDGMERKIRRRWKTDEITGKSVQMTIRSWEDRKYLPRTG